MKEVKTLSVESFNQEVILSKETMMVFYWAEWCGPCKSMLPVFESISSKFINAFNISKINVGNLSQIPDYLTVKCTPTIALFRNGKNIDHISGVVTQEKIEELIIKNKLITKNQT